MKLADDYQNFYSDTWLTAKQALDDTGMEEEKSNFLLNDILVVSETYYWWCVLFVCRHWFIFE